MSDYFSDQVSQGQPIMPPTVAQAPSVPQAPNVDKTASEVVDSNKTEWNGLPVRSIGDKVWLLRGGRKHHVTSPEVYNKLGFKFGDESKIDDATLDVIPEGEPIH